nr:retrotransposon protein, putative, unclassified [Tanacetum cinerariifolium]
MAVQRYRDEHNKVGYLLKHTGSDDYHQIIDFLMASHIRYALTHDPIIFDSLVKQICSTATLRSPELGPPAIQATIDKTSYIITEDLVRSQLQLVDDGGIDDLPIAEIYSGMDILGYVTEGKLTFFKNKFSPQWRFLVHTIRHCLSTKFGIWDQFGSPLAVALICLSDGRQFNWFSYIFKGMVSNIGNAKKFLMYPTFLQTILGIETRNKRQYKVLSQDKYVKEILNKFDLGSVKTATTPYEASKPKSKNKSDSPVNVCSSYCRVVVPTGRYVVPTGRVVVPTGRYVVPAEFGMIANLITGADTEEASTAGDAGEFDLLGVTSELTLKDKIRVLSIELENTSNLLKHSERINADVETAKKELQIKLDNHLVQTKKWRISSKNMFRLIDSSMSIRTKVGLGFNNYIKENELGWDDSAFSVFTTNSKDVEGRPIFNRLAKADSMKVVPPPLSGDYTSLLDHIDLRITDVLCDKSSEVNTNDFASSDSSVKSSEPKPKDSTSCASTSSISTYENEAEIESNVGTPIQEPIIVQDLPSFSCNSSDKNENTSRTSCNKNGYFNKKASHFRKNASFVSKLCFVCGSGTHLIKDCDFYEKQMVNKTVGIGVGPVHSRNKVNHQNQFVPQAVLLRTGKVNIPPARPQPVPAGKSKVFTPVPIGRQNSPFPVPTDRGSSPSVISGWWKSTASPMPDFSRPTSSYFQPYTPYVPTMYYNHMKYDGDRWATAVKPSVGCSWKSYRKGLYGENPFPNAEDQGVFDSGCSRSMTGNKKTLDDFQVFQGGKVTFGGGEGRITGKGTIRTPTLDFENVYYVKELQQFNLFSISQVCNKKNKVLFTDTECLVLSKDFKLPDESYKHDKANQSAGTQEATTNPAGTEPKDTSGDAVDDSPLNSIDENFQTELARLKGQEQSSTSDAERLGLRFENDAEELQKRGSAKIIPPGSIPVPTCSILVPSGDTMVSTDDVPVHTRSPTDSFFDDEPTTRFPNPPDLGNHDPSPGIFSSSSYDDEFGDALNNVASIVEVIKPSSVAHALEDPSWVDAMQEEMQQFKFQNVWVLVDFPEGKYAIGTKWILKNKRDARGIVVQNKDRLVAQGHRQEEGIDYDEVFAPVARIEAIRLFLAFASYMGFMVYQMDVKSVFLYGRIDKEAWCDEFEALMKGEFQMSAMGELTFFLGLQVQQRPDGMFISQDKYVQEILNKFDLESVRTTTIPYEAPKPKSNNESDSPVNVHLYRSMIGSLMYLTASSPDIMSAVSTCSRNQVTPTTSNLEAVKKIFKYLKGQPKLGLWYPRESPFVLEAYSDSDYAGANKDRKSTTGGCHFLGRRLISWQCKKQTIMATSSTEAEASHIRYALTHIPIIFDSLLKQFWSTATLKSPELGPPAIQATIDETPYTITEDLVRSQLQLADDGGIDDLPIANIYYGMDNLGTKFGSWDQFGSPLTVALICLSDGRQFNWSSYIFKGMVSNIGNAKKFLIQQTSDPNALVFEHGQSSDSNIASFSQNHETDNGPFTNVEDETLGGSFHMSPPSSTQAPSVGYGGKLVKKVKAMEVKLRTSKRKMVVSDSDQEEGGKQDVDLDALLSLANAAVTVDYNIPPGGASNNPAASTSVPADVPTSVAPLQRGYMMKNKLKWTDKEQSCKERDNKKFLLQPCIILRLIGSTSWLRLRLTHLSSRHCWDRPMTQGQQRTYMRQFVKNQSCAIYSTGWSMVHVKSFTDDQLKEEFEKIQKALSNIQIQAFNKTLKRTGPVLEEPSSKRQKSTEAPILSSALVGWEIIPTPLGEINALYRIDRSTAYFTTLREILHMVDIQDLLTLYGLVVKYYDNHPVAGAGLILWGDLQVLFDSQEGEVVYMFADVSYHFSVKLIERMLKHKLEIDKDVVGNDVTTAEQLI